MVVLRIFYRKYNFWLKIIFVTKNVKIKQSFLLIYCVKYFCIIYREGRIQGAAHIRTGQNFFLHNWTGQKILDGPD